MTGRAVRGPGRPAGRELVVDRTAVLDNAELVIRRDGASASIEAIARESGVTKPIVYARVGDRSELANALAERLTRRLVTATATAVERSGGGRAAVADLIRVTLETLQRDRELFLYVTGGNKSDDRLLLAGQIIAPVARQLQRWRGDDELDADVAEAWAYATIGMLNLVSLWWINEADREAHVLAEQLTELLWSGLSGL